MSDERELRMGKGVTQCLPISLLLSKRTKGSPDLTFPTNRLISWSIDVSSISWFVVQCLFWKEFLIHHSVQMVWTTVYSFFYFFCSSEWIQLIPYISLFIQFGASFPLTVFGWLLKSCFLRLNPYKRIGRTIV